MSHAEGGSTHPDEPAGSPEQPDAGASAVEWADLPKPLRGRLAELAATAVGSMREVDIPASLRMVVRFAPAKRAKLGASALITALRDVKVFRAAVADWCRTHQPDAISMEHSDPLVVAAAAILLDAPVARHCVELVAYRTDEGRLRGERDSALARAEKLAAEADGLRRELAEAKRATERAGDTNNVEVDRLRKRFQEQRAQAKRARSDAEEARAELTRIREDSEQALARLTTERDRERSQAREQRTRAERADTEAQVAWQAVREARRGDEVRLGLLLRTLEGAVAGLRRELGATGSGPRPADAINGVLPQNQVTGHLQDAGALDKLLALPAVHVIVDGYNVTKTGYPELPLTDQRDRLAHQLAALGARTGAEVTVVFDGADVVSVPATGPRGVRVLFSEHGVQADDVIRDLVDAEPKGRQVVVVTSDRAVAASVRRRGAFAVASAILLERLHRV
jgi:predicted RNA-binding protein with PIN domain